MARDLHTLSMLSGAALAMEDRLIFGHLSAQVSPAGNGTVTAIGAGSAGSGYQTIPTVALSVPSSGAKNTGSGATATAVMKVLSAAVVNAGDGSGTPGAVTITGTTGTGTKFQATGTIDAGGLLVGPLVVTVGGAYTALPSLTAAAVSGGSLVGATVSLVMGVASYTVGSAGSNYPVGSVTASVSGGTPVTPAVPGAVTVTSAAGASSAVDYTGPLPAAYAVLVTPAFDGTAWVSAKTQAGFIINFSPRLAATTLAASTYDMLIAA